MVKNGTGLFTLKLPYNGLWTACSLMPRPAPGLFLSICFIMTLGMASSAYPQIGLRGGVNLAKFTGLDAGPAEGVMGLNAGLSFRLLGIGPVSLNPEIYYAQKGSRLTDQIYEQVNTGTNPEQLGEKFDLEFKLAYIEVPVLIKVNLPFLSTNNLSPYLSGGPVFAWRLDCNFSLETSADRTLRECTEGKFDNFDTTFNSADRGYVAGAGIDFRVPYLGTLNLDIRLTKGLTRLRNNDINDDIHNQSFTIMLGYSF